MIPRHAAALALVGWYLMVPPVRGAPGMILGHAPLWEWQSYDYYLYDSKAECEKAIPSDKEIQENMKQCSNGDCAINTALPGLGRCFAENDPRLKKKKSGKGN
jgi:hypothetical protein